MHYTQTFYVVMHCHSNALYTDVLCSNALSKRMYCDVFNSTVNRSVQSGLTQLQSFVACLDLLNGIL
jgi:hypothetical protein